MEVPDVSYARSGDVFVACQTLGEGQQDLVFLPFLPGWQSTSARVCPARQRPEKSSFRAR